MRENCERKAKLVKLDPLLSKGSYHGFVLKKDYWYGNDERGTPVATSGWVYNGYLCIYTLLEPDHWSNGWISIEDCEIVFPEFYNEYRNQVFHQRRRNCIA